MNRVLSIAIISILTLSTFATLLTDVGSINPQFQMQPLIEAPTDDSAATILKDSDGKIWVFFISYGRIDTGHAHIFYITSVDDGISWTEPAVFNRAYVAGVDAVNGVAVFQDSTGKFWVAWTIYRGIFDEDEIWFTTSYDGVDWADARVLCRHGNKMGNFIEAHGKIWFFFSPRLPNYFHASYITTVDGGNSWSNVLEITSSYDSYPRAIVLSNGTIFVVYNHYPNTIGYCSSSDGGLTWTNTLFDNPEYDSSPSTIEYAAKIYIFFRRRYQEWLPPSDIWFRVWDGTGWESSQQMTNDPEDFDNGPNPAIINHQIWIVWDKGDPAATHYDSWLAKTTSTPRTLDFFLHGCAYLDNNSPTAVTAKYKDSPGIKFSGGNLWKEIGIWAAPASLTAGTLEALVGLDVWLGLKNSDDQGTNFDLRAEVYKDGVLEASGETYLIKGVTRNPDKALKVTVSFNSFPPVDFDGTTNVLSLKILTRIGTDGNGNFGGGHSNAVGLRLYFDAITRPAKLTATIA